MPALRVGTRAGADREFPTTSEHGSKGGEHFDTLGEAWLEV